MEPVAKLLQELVVTVEPAAKLWKSAPMPYLILLEPWMAMETVAKLLQKFVVAMEPVTKLLQPAPAYLVILQKPFEEML